MPGFVENILHRLSSIFNKAQLRHFGEYLTGLMVSENKTVTGINSQFLNHTDQSSKNHFLNEAGWDEKSVTDERLRMIKEQFHYRLYRKEEDVPQGAFQSKLGFAIQLIEEAMVSEITVSCVAAESRYFYE